ncbi:hypothetical protein [Rhizobium halophytocola]|uniref:Uncharacterized protein n=1 Tax=Rhizobium halophytocola TaxID=735519 RepID=A0ABS4DYV4_9HYPH|nr:hypothetical protein [Rhizobium halophytocola]MBP1850870.1 hypothetical protein [Rhizobium halophytocola]
MTAARTIFLNVKTALQQIQHAVSASRGYSDAARMRRDDSRAARAAWANLD